MSPARQPKRYLGLDLRVHALRLIAVLTVAGSWLYMTGPGEVSPLILPRPSAVWVEAVAFASSWQVYSAALVTLGEISAAFAISATAGVIVGAWGARTDLRARVMEPLLVWGYLIPIVLFYPLFVLAFGFGVYSKIAYAAFGSFSPIAFNCLRGFRRVEPAYVSIGRAFGASPRQMDWTIKFRAALPLVTAGLQIGAALCMITVIVAEMLASTQGLGFLIRWYSQSFNTARTFAIIMVVLIMAGLFQFAVRRLLASPKGSQLL